jgi:hypothetical protein
MIVAILQRPLDPMLTLGVCGFALFTFAWVGMYFRLKRELPEHALVAATYLNLSTGIVGRRRAGPGSETCLPSYSSTSNVTASTRGHCY